MAPPPHASVDPRIAHTHRVVRDAALAELAAVGYGAFTVEGVAARAGVAKSTIYRHWSGRADLVIDALEAINQQPGNQRQSGTIDDGLVGLARVRQLLHHLVTAMVDDRLGPTLAALVDAAERDPDIARLHRASNDRRRSALVAAITDAMTAGEIDGTVDADLAAVSLAGAITYSRLLTATPLPVEAIDDLVVLVLRPPGGGLS